ncbi:hypothetical protein Vadar_014335 [Vaccinium darrowii]|uniref:Uncharacterized protein n=1 Tax=Vaccinium darrowii TaxID=229202 RepID=A0ACB7XZ58_9ERIC|nr:hypothetical protein Vadar_014335 [Vaccinium darrowii]
MTRKRIRDEEGSNHNEIEVGEFIWKKKKIESRKDDRTRYSKKKQREWIMAEIEKLRKRREERAIEKAHREEERVFLARERARAEFHDDFWERKEQDFLSNQSKLRSEILRLRQQSCSNKAMKEEEGDDGGGGAVFGDEVKLLYAHSHDRKYCPRKPKYLNRVHTWYDWNKYNRTHYDHHNPPPKMVQGYKFNIFYADLDAKNKAPTYTIENDGHSSETCIIRFHAGPPYEDLAFRIVNQEWEHSCKKGFKCAFEPGILRLYFNFKRFHYRR